MWPDQQPPGGAQNPQGNPQNNQQGNPQHNPYQQPGYQQPNPYQQPGYQQYPQAGQYDQQQYGQQQQWGQQQPPTVPVPQAPQGGGGRTRLIAIVAATAVVVAAGVTGYLVLGGKDDKNNQADNGKSGQHTSQSPTSQPTPTSSATDDPRGTQSEKPTVAGWKVVVNPRWGVAYDVPADWEIQAPGLDTGFDFPKTEKDKAIVMSGTAQDKPKWCTSDDDKDGRTDDTPLAVVGSKGASGAKDTDEIAINTPAWWVYGGYTQPDKKSITFDKKATPFTTDSGIKGSYGWAQSTHTPKKGKCVTDGKALTFGFQNSAHDYVSFNFYGASGVNGEVPKATIMKILGSVRLHGDPTNQ
ncbi:hypothetical protein AQI95_39965 [Streptomyces yokosukanensis]|uniref:DUF8017 domain-containing protein n=1 Tax=Streptomyces yokosukanensis TaxID=67386 RepID=A0A124HE11_9ACTN|nr:hypothetical protein [Streptomyces yokosukanensis]KUM99216.1 hypothetical protein AQI95_39965 [Streptomyces yokosukanensis]